MPSKASTCRSTPAPCSGSSAPTARARPPWSESSPRCSGLDGGSGDGRRARRHARRRGAAVPHRPRRAERRGRREPHGPREPRAGGTALPPAAGRGAPPRRRTCSTGSGLSDAADRTAKTYSGGMRRRLDLAASLVGRPDVLFLDEPTTGLDPRSRIDVWEFIRELQNEGTTLMLTTQYLDEADQLADKIAVIDVGTVIAEGTSDELKDQIGGEVLELHVEERSDIARVMQALDGVGSGEPTSDDRRGTRSDPRRQRGSGGAAGERPTARRDRHQARRHRPAPAHARRRVPLAHRPQRRGRHRRRAGRRRRVQEEAPRSARPRKRRRTHEHRRSRPPAPGAPRPASAAASRWP